MSEAIKSTPGPWEAKPTGPWDGWDGWSVEDATGAVVCDAHGSQRDGRREANARMIAEAGTVFHTTGMTPMQLVERVKELEGALQLAFKALDAIGDEMTVGERYTNAGQYLLDSLPPARAALAKCQGAKE